MFVNGVDKIGIFRFSWKWDPTNTNETKINIGLTKNHKNIIIWFYSIKQGLIKFYNVWIIGIDKIGIIRLKVGSNVLYLRDKDQDWIDQKKYLLT